MVKINKGGITRFCHKNELPSWERRGYKVVVEKVAKPKVDKPSKLAK